MPRCDTCGNDYDKAFEVRTADGTRHIFDSFECAIHRVAPRCSHCKCAVIGHGIESEGEIYCCAYCASQCGVSGARDRVESHAHLADLR